MYRSLKTPFKTSKEDFIRFRELNKKSAEVWNACLVLSKLYYKIHQKWIGKNELQKTLKQYEAYLHTQSVQSIADSYCEARNGTREARKKGYNNKYPYKRKKFYPTTWKKDGITIISNDKIQLSLGNWDKKRQPKLSFRLVKPLPPNAVIKEVQLFFDKGYHLSISYEDGVEVIEKEQGETTAIDIGEIHTISAVSTNKESVIITGRKVRSIHQFRNKKLKELQKKMSKCQKGSNRWKKYNRALQFVLSKSEKQLKDALHKTTKQFVDWCVAQNTKTVLIGDVEGVQRNTSRRKKKKVRRRTTNQKLSNWSFGKLHTYLEYKLESKGMSLLKVDEAYTSQTCPVCGNRKKVSSRNYTCKCGYRQHRDIHGACNILSKELYGRFVLIPVNKPKYLRPV